MHSRSHGHGGITLGQAEEFVLAKVGTLNDWREGG